MHTAQQARRRGIARSLLEHVVGYARTAGYRRLSLETGSTEEFAPARALYKEFGFTLCAPFAGYTESSYNTFMTLELPGSG